MILRLGENIREVVKVIGNRSLWPLGRLFFEIAVKLGYLLVGGLFHRTVVEYPRERAAQFRTAPIRSCLGDEEMKERVVCRGNSAPQAGLVRLLRMEIGDILSELKQFVCIRHRIMPTRAL